jgi:hypothetical protein
MVLFLFLFLCSLVAANGESVYLTRLFADCNRTETFVLVDDTSKVNELKPILIISRDGKYREVHGIRHVYDGRYIHLTERLLADFLSGARIYQEK